MSGDEDDELLMENGYSRKRFDHDLKKTAAMHEMVSVRNMAHRVYYQCVCVFATIGITLVVIVAMDPYKYYVPVASHFIAYAGIVTYLLIMLALLTCARDASTRFGLVIAVTMLLGVSVGFLFGINITLNSDKIQFYSTQSL